MGYHDVALQGWSLTNGWILGFLKAKVQAQIIVKWWLVQVLGDQGIMVEAHGWPDEQAMLPIKVHHPIRVLEVNGVTCVVSQSQGMLEDEN